ncbi:MAG: Ig-like domain-containing protein, partial [Cyanobacteria bacterium J06648_11]
AAIADEALHVVADFGDASGNGILGNLDASLTAQVGEGLTTGFDAWGAIDPSLIADTGEAGFAADDARAIARKAVQLDEDRIPDLPENREASTITQLSPNNGEELVATTREAIVRFSEPVVPETVNEETLKVIALGEEVSGRIVVSSTERFATFFPDEPWSSSTEVRIEVDGQRILGRDGQPLDADRDGFVGGVETADFTTLPLTQIPGTDVTGFVFDSYNRAEDGSNIPLQGVEIRLDALPDISAVTDENGFFRLEDVPAPEFFVYIDGSEAIGADGVAQYASLGKPFHSVPGQETQLTMDGEVFDIYLPPMAESDVEELSPNEDTEVGFGPASLALLEEQFPDIDPAVWEQTQVTFPAGSAVDDEGNAATRATIVPVEPDRLPAPLPPGLEAPLVISIQAGMENGFNREADGGATNFDVPAPLSFPNLDGLSAG